MDLKVWFVRKREFIIFILISVIIGLATYKYVAHGESYRFETHISDEKIQVNSNTIRQDIIIDEKSVWDKYSYAVYLYTEHKVKEGTINVHLRQNDRLLESIEIIPHNIVAGWCVLDGFRYTDLKPGTATLEISSTELDQVVALGLCRNTYNLPNCFLDGIDTGYTLTQRYHYNFNNYEVE